MKFHDVDQAELKAFAAGRQDLPFVVTRARTYAQLQDAAALRKRAYGHHDRQIGEAFGQVEPVDLRSDTIVLTALDKASGHCVASARMRTNAEEPLDIQHYVGLPQAWSSELMCEVTRMSADPTYGGPLVLGMMKAIWLTSMALQVRRIVISAREKVAPGYEMLGFADVYEDQPRIPMPHVGNLLHRVLTLDLNKAQADWREQSHALYDFFQRVYHPDLRVHVDAHNINFSEGDPQFPARQPHEQGLMVALSSAG